MAVYYQLKPSVHYGYLAFKKNPFQKKNLRYSINLRALSDAFANSIYFLFFYKGFKGYPLFFATTITIIIALLIYKRTFQYLLKAGILFFIITSAITLLLPNYFNYLSYQEPEINNAPLASLVIYEESGKRFVPKKGKITVLDIWDSSCGVCIKQFPKFDGLAKEYDKDKEIVFYTLNLPRKNDVREEVSGYTANYSFGKLYADESVQKLLKIKLVPQYMILNDKGEIKYLGSLNTGTFEFYNNFYTIIENIKKQ